MLCVSAESFLLVGTHTINMKDMKYNHYIKFNLVEVDDAVAIKVVVDRLQVLVTDIQSLNFYAWLEKRYTFPDDRIDGCNFDVIPEKFMVGVSRKMTILSVFFENRAIDSDLFTRLVHMYRQVTPSDWDCDLMRFVRLFMTKEMSSKFQLL